MKVLQGLLVLWLMLLPFERYEEQLENTRAIYGCVAIELAKDWEQIVMRRLKPARR